MVTPISFGSPYPNPTPSVQAPQPSSVEIEQSGVISFGPPPFVPPSAPSAPSSPVEVEPEPDRVLGSTSKRHLVGPPPAMWGWEQLRDYVVEEIVAIHGNFPRNLLKESGIFKGFISRHGARSAEIATYAMEVSGGWWKNSPIGVERFAKGSDPWFAEEILQIIDSRKRESNPLTETSLSA